MEIKLEVEGNEAKTRMGMKLEEEWE